MNNIKDMELNKVYEYKEKLGKKVYVMKTEGSDSMDKVVHWFAWPQEDGTFVEEPEEERSMIDFDTFQNLLKSKRIIKI